MAIPAFDEYGNLPPGIYDATWDEVADRFSRSPERRRLLVGLRAALDLLAACGCRWVWLDGSSVTDMETIAGCPPGDVDVCWEIAGVDLARMADIAPELHPLSGSPAVRYRRYSGDYFAVSEPSRRGWSISSNGRAAHDGRGLSC